MSNIESMEDIQNLFKETIATFMESGLESELDDELGYDRYDYKNKQTDNSRNGHSQKTLRTSFGDVEVDRIQKYHGIDTLQGPLLPLFGLRQDLIRDSADGGI